MTIGALPKGEERRPSDIRALGLLPKLNVVDSIPITRSKTLRPTRPHPLTRALPGTRDRVVSAV